MSKILIAVASEKEVSPFLQQIEISLDKKNIYHFSFLGHQCCLCIHQAGLLSTTFHLTNCLHRFSPDMAFQIGVAGSFRPHIKPLDIVQVKKEIIFPFGFEDTHGTYYPYTKNDFIEMDSELTPKHTVPIKNKPQVVSLTTQKVHACKKTMEQIKQDLHPDIENMEGAAFFYVCNKFNIPCVELRAISNYTGNDNREEWQVEEASALLCKELYNQIENRA